MPWWLITYIIVLVLIEGLGIKDNIARRWGASKITLSIFSLMSKLIFIFIAYDEPVSEGLIYFIIPLLLLTLIWDVYEFKRDCLEAESDYELTAEEFKIIISISIALTILLELPAYLAAGFILYKNLNS